MPIIQHFLHVLDLGTELTKVHFRSLSIIPQKNYCIRVDFFWRMWYDDVNGGGVMLRIAVVDDEEYICSILDRYIRECCVALQMECEVDIFNTGERFIHHLGADNSYHLLFLDIELKQCSGIDVSTHIRNVMMDESLQIVYVSGKNGYDRQLFSFRPFGFVGKPFDQIQISEVIKKYIHIYGNKSDIFHYKVGHDKFWIKLSDVLYFKGLDRKVLIKRAKNEDVFYGSLEKVKEQVKGQGFLYPHKSYIVNYRYIRSFQLNVIILTNGEELPIAKSRQKEIAKAQIILERGGSYYVD